MWAVEHFDHYTFANKVHIISDHKPLQPLFNGKMLVTCIPRTARLLLKIIDKDIKFYYQMYPACVSVMRFQGYHITTLREGMLRKSKGSTYKFVKLVLFDQTSLSPKYKLKLPGILICNSSSNTSLTAGLLGNKM